MNKQELQNEINKTKEHLANMEKMLAECEYERWKPNRYDIFYYLNEYNEVERSEFCDDEADRYLYETFNCFQTKEQAEQETEKILVRRMLEDIARRLNKGEKIDWKDKSQIKYFIYLDKEYDKLNYANNIWCKFQGTVHCLDQNFLDVAIKEIGEERLNKYLRGE